MAYIIPPGSTVAFQGTVPWSVLGTVVTSGSVVAVPTGNQSVSGTLQVDVRGSVAVAIIGGSIAASFTPPANQSVSGTVVVNQGTSPWIITGSVQASLTPAANQSVSGTVNVGSLLTTLGYVSTGNSISSQLSSGSVFTGAWEEVKDFSAIYITINSDVASATNGLSLQRSANASSVMTSDEYTIPAQTGKTYQIQPDARFFRVQYTNSAANQGAMALQTVYKQSYSKPSSQRPSDGYTNETDLEQMQGFNMVYNGATWDRMRGTTAGMFVTGSVQQGTTPWNIAGSVAAFQAGTQVTSISGGISSVALAGANTVSIVSAIPLQVVSSLAGGIFPISGSVAAVVTNSVNVNGSVVATQGTSPWVVNFQNSSILAVPVGSVTTVFGLSPSIVGTYAEDAGHTDGNKGLFALGVRNDAVASFVGANLDYAPLATDSAGRIVTKPFTPEESAFRAIASFASASIFNVVPAAGTGLRNYITDVAISNTGAATTLVTFRDGDASIIGRYVAPTGGGSNMPGLNVPFKGTVNGVIDAVLSTSTSLLYVNMHGYRAP